MMLDADLEFSTQQTEAIKAVDNWLANRTDEQQIFRLFGYAGTGKTTIAKHLAANLEGSVVYMAFTGKAALMMRRNGCVGASTIHSAIYTVNDKGNGDIEFVLNPESACADCELIVIDECSMVGIELADDILSFGKPILVLGDPAQLPPVESAGFFTEAKPDAMLTEIHRQAADNPIIGLATLVRQGHHIDDIWEDFADTSGTRIVTRGTLAPSEVAAADQVLVGTHVMRHAFNRRLRAVHGRSSDLPEEGDRLICIRNNREKHLFNGGLFTCVKTPIRRKDHKKLRLKIQSLDFPDRPVQTVHVRTEFFLGGLDALTWKDLRHTDRFEFGYALTCHKAQGSQWGSVIAYDESSVFRRDANRWLYTAITRASDHLTLVV